MDIRKQSVMHLGSQLIYGTKIEGKGSSSLGVVDDLLFDDATRGTRYLVVNTTRWLPGRKFLVPPLEIAETDRLDHRVRIERSRREIEARPPFEESWRNNPNSKPTSRSIGYWKIAITTTTVAPDRVSSRSKHRRRYFDVVSDKEGK